ncbi:type I restriction-modification system subunit M [Streptomyces millisiae]|uniref:site-specific DNA-methyltransferase (adenine-specific) n=1 Tax=Streptomyces millisiae TaxID=3075542 RepID=A0ABU2LLF6_9ACTN|nr:class I SAM-dependent DNA methyltransferase [Streptomyces sp. DSM 44918]MDT0318424.1 class I SAM-dependent DNA methyltransferase [Streptomyces sp. DSM 44918]
MAQKEATEQLALDSGTSRALTLSELERHLLGAADLLRGLVDQADFKSYIFPLFFYKRLCDVYGEEYEEALELSDGDREFAAKADQHRFVIPEGHRWSDVVATPDHELGGALITALREVEKANPEKLDGIFGDTPWTNRDRVPPRVLRALLDHFSARFLGDAHADSDLLGQAYEYLIKKFADLSNKKAGEFYTPRAVVELLVNILAPRAGETVYDPACGTGGMLIEVANHFARQGIPTQRLYGKVFGQEKNLTTSGIARMNLILHKIEDFRIERGDTLRHPVFTDREDRLKTFDCVIANPPFSLAAWGDDSWDADPFGRGEFGTPPTSTADWAWVQHMIASMRPDTGRAVVVLPQGILFRGGREAKIRKKIIEADAIESVIGLGGKLFYGAELAACVLVLRARKPKERRGKILFVDASDQFRKSRNQNVLEAEHTSRIHGWYRAFANIEGRSHLADEADIAKHDGSLSISLYVSKNRAAELPSLADAIVKLEGALADAAAAEDELRHRLKEWGFLG